MDHSQLKAEIAIQMVNIKDPWTSIQRQSSCLKVVAHTKSKQIRGVSSRSWPEFEEGFLRVSAHDWTENEFSELLEQ